MVYFVIAELPWVRTAQGLYICALAAWGQHEIYLRKMLTEHEDCVDTAWGLCETVGGLPEGCLRTVWLQATWGLSETGKRKLRLAKEKEISNERRNSKEKDVIGVPTMSLNCFEELLNIYRDQDKHMMHVTTERATPRMVCLGFTPNFFSSQMPHCLIMICSTKILTLFISKMEWLEALGNSRIDVRHITA